MNEESTIYNQLSFKEKIYRKLYEVEDTLFEKRFGMELNQIVSKVELNTIYPTKEHASPYMAVYTRNLRELFNEARKTGLNFEYFIDVGCGKGKPCFYAKIKFPHAKIIGIDFSNLLIEIANSNKLKVFPNDNITFINLDATEYKIPQATNLIFLFNPFDNIILEKFIRNNYDNFHTKKSIIAYANDIHKNTLTKMGFDTIFRNQSRKISLLALP
jgi:SAM-dependent methyltransferase